MPASRRVLTILLALSLPRAAIGADLAISAADHAPVAVSVAMLSSLPPANVTLTRSGTSASYRGPTLWDVLARAGAISPDPHRRLHEIVTVTGADRYSAPVALAEIDPAFEDKGVILAVSRDGKPLEGPRLVVPGDKRPGRDVRDVVAISVR